MKKVYVLGAGASAFAGYPLGFDLWRFIRGSDGLEVNSRQAHAEVMAVIEPILRLNPQEEYDRPDLEKLFTLLDLAHRGVGPVELRRTDWPLTRQKIIRLIVDSFQWQEWQWPAPRFPTSHK